MTRVPLDSLPQRRLVDLMRTEIDKAMRSRDRADGVLLLVAANPRSAFSTHVLYNLGERRCRWLSRALQRARVSPALPVRPEASSLASLRKIEGWFSDT